MAIGQTKETQLIANDSYVDIETKAKLSFKLPVHLGQLIKITNENELIQQIPNEINHIQWEEKKKLNYNKFTGNTLKHLIHWQIESEFQRSNRRIEYIDNAFSSQKCGNDRFTLLIGIIAWLIAK